jgi:hypothetical protein
LSGSRISDLRREWADPSPVELVSRLIQNTEKQRQRDSVSKELKTSVNQLLTHAETLRLSQRKLAARIGLTFRTWRRIRDGHANPLTWLPTIRTALESLHASRITHHAFN